jgi:hypothetical protein
VQLNLHIFLFKENPAIIMLKILGATLPNSFFMATRSPRFVSYGIDFSGMTAIRD